MCRWELVLNGRKIAENESTVVVRSFETLPDGEIEIPKLKM